MPYLDCHDLETTLASVARAVGVKVDRLEQALRNYDEGGFESSSENPYELMPREVLEQFGTAVNEVRFGGAYYFHGTRVLDPEGFRTQGIRPFRQMVEPIWPMLYEFVRQERAETEWTQFRKAIETDAGGHDGSLYRLKTKDHPDRGPYALLVRETLLNPNATGSHDYLGCPEIVQDIARCYLSMYGVDLERRFYTASKACIVKFRTPQLWPDQVSSALWYAYAKLRGNRLTSNLLSCFEGVTVSAKSVVGVEVVTAG